MVSVNSLAFPNESNTDAIKEAGDTIGSVLYKQYNGDFYMENMAQLILDKKYWKYITPAGNIGKMVIERKVTIKYEF